MLPKLFLPFILLLLFGASNALKCYDCNDCVRNKAEVEECDDSETVCTKFKVGDLIFKECKREEFCSLKTLEKGFHDAVDKVKNVFTGAEPPKRADAVSCCYTDYCNAGNGLRNALGVVGALLLALSLAHF